MSSGRWRAWTAAAERLVSATLPLSLLAVLIWLAPACGDDMQMNPGGVRISEFWRAFTCHFTHWSLNHLIWDVIAFAVLGLLCERRAPRRFLACLGAAIIAIPLMVGLRQPELAYRGLSGLDSALFALLAGLLLREKRSSHEPIGIVLALMMIASLAGKIGYEVSAGHALFVADASMVPVPLAHAAGAVVGLAAGVLPVWRHPSGDAIPLPLSSSTELAAKAGVSRPAMPLTTRAASSQARSPPHDPIKCGCGAAPFSWSRRCSTSAGGPMEMSIW